MNASNLIRAVLHGAAVATTACAMIASAPLLAQSNSFDAAGRLARQSDSSGGRVVYSYDAADNLAASSYVAAAGNPPVLASAALQSGFLGVAFTATLQSSRAGTSFSATGLPPGLVLNGATGVISGTPSAVGVFAVTVTLSVGGQSGADMVSIQVRPATAAPAVVRQPLSRAAVLGQPVALFAEVSGGAPLRFQWARNGAALAGQTSPSLVIAAFAAADEGDYVLTAANAAGSVSTVAARLARSQPLAINGESYGLPVSYAGTPAFFAQTAVSFDGTPALQSGAVGSSQQCSFGTQVTGPGRLTFRWKVSSQAGGDLLAFNLDGALLPSVPSISGEVDWTLQTVLVPAGTHSLAWGYAKNGSITAGRDAGWVGNVAFTPGFALAAVARGQGQVIASSAADTFAPGTAVVLTAVADPGRVFVGWTGDVTSSSNPLTVTMDAHKSVTAVFKENLGPTLGAASLVFTADGSADWFAQPFVTQDGGTGGQAGAIGNGQQTFVQTTVNGPGRISFSWKVSSEANYDFLTFSIDGVAQERISGEVDWARRTFAVPAGAHILRWTYSKDASNAAGQDTAWLDAVAFAADPPSPMPTPTPTPVPGVASKLINLATRLRVETGDNIGIGGFVVAGTGTKQVLIRAIGPSLSAAGVTGALADPIVQVIDGQGQTVATNDNWRSSQEALIRSTGLAPTSDAESAVVLDLPPGGYTALLRGVNDGQGVALVEVYELQVDSAQPIRLINLSTRGRVQTGDNVMIGGLVVSSGPGKRVLFRALGPSLAAAGVPNPLANPRVDVYDASGQVIASNDDWQAQTVAGSTSAEISALGLAPLSGAEAALIVTLPPGGYTAIVRGADGGSGVALIEAYELP